jgi:hypothetical protein
MNRPLKDLPERLQTLDIVIQRSEQDDCELVSRGECKLRHGKFKRRVDATNAIPW